MNVAANPFSPPRSALPKELNLSRVGIRFGLLFGSPFLLVAVLGAIAVVADHGMQITYVPFVGLMLGAAYATCACGWWWAMKTPAGLRWFLVTGLAMGLLVTAGVFALILSLITAADGRWPPNFGGLGSPFANVAPYVTLWLMLLGGAVRWRVRVLQRRAVGRASDIEGEVARADLELPRSEA